MKKSIVVVIYVLLSACTLLHTGCSGLGGQKSLEQFHYDKIKMNNDTFPVRINNETEKTEILYPEGWQEVHAIDEAKTREQEQKIKLKTEQKELSEEEKSKTEFSAEAEKIGNITKVTVSGYNGTDYQLEHMTISLSYPKNKNYISDKPASHRLYDLVPIGSVMPRSDGSFSTYVFINYSYFENEWEWNVHSLKGTKK